MSKILLLDGFNLAFRSYYGLPDLTRSDGFPTGAIHGWVKTLWKLEDMESPDLVVVFFDEGGSDRHQELLPDYKANRDEMPEALSQQLPYLRQVAELIGFPVVSREGVEADDLIASAARRFTEAGDNVVIVSADKDLGQCVGQSISQLLPAPTANPRLGWRRLDSAGVEKKFGVPPAQVPDYLALVGDVSDNIPGIQGVGPKTATKWLLAHESIDGILENADQLTPPRFREKVAESAELLKLNLKLVTLEFDHDVGVLEKQAPKTNELVKLLEEMEMGQSASLAWDRYGLGLG
ncbi:5'-3' exonuclease [Rubellicoccus peritrichatus]|uniref:5'-3' exonuclease H3TH domain-containing protein n=1 Tax=Rubellicoccus peritrichatus TaxID=3080537 RepID=A0AAQ3QTZ6_9BACT|nr:5'-3' exonuclease H3TH domain-containing protein [Puniceicoccus sp. CR14]WOO41881.1 5'-3' exonuclease H3TH domain-containing protein [Puniceicoccus sp. CR14]